MSRLHAYCLTSLRLRSRRHRLLFPCPWRVPLWGLLAGSMAIDAQFTPLQAPRPFRHCVAGAAQLVAIGMVKSGASLISIVLTTLLLTSQHLLYGMPYVPPRCRHLISRWRIGLGFLLTDEFFALVSHV